MRALLSLVFATVACSSSGSSSAPDAGGFTPASDDAGNTSTTFGELRSGIATYYDATGAGNCSFDATPDDLDVVALQTTMYAGSAWCGACVKVQGPKGNVTVRVVDSCPTCENANHIDLSQQAFAKIAEVSAGRVDVKWQFVPCAVSGPIAYHFKEGSNPYWTAIQIRNHRVPIAKVEAKKKGAWQTLKRVDYNYFLDESGLGDGPYDLRVTSIEGKSIEDPAIGFAEATTVAGASQL
jgi:expansin (peptidoglycan-binding protein)